MAKANGTGQTNLPVGLMLISQKKECRKQMKQAYV
jgi:hypothetical protein